MTKQQLKSKLYPHNKMPKIEEDFIIIDEVSEFLKIVGMKKFLEIL